MKIFSRGRFSAFTLIELVIAVAILAILVTAAIIAMQNIIRNAQISRLKATLKSVRSELLVQKTKNQLENSNTDAAIGGCHPRVNFWPTFEEVRSASFEAQVHNSILDSILPDNPFIDPPPRIPPFNNVFSSDPSCDVCFNNNVGSNNMNNLVVCTETGHKGDPCGATDCQAAYAYNPRTGEFWANSNQMGEINW